MATLYAWRATEDTCHFSCRLSYPCLEVGEEELKDTPCPQSLPVSKGTGRHAQAQRSGPVAAALHSPNPTSQIHVTLGF